MMITDAHMLLVNIFDVFPVKHWLTEDNAFRFYVTTIFIENWFVKRMVIYFSKYMKGFCINRLYRYKPY